MRLSPGEDLDKVCYMWLIIEWCIIECYRMIQSDEIGPIALKAAKLFEKELCESMKQTFVSDFFDKKLLLDTATL